MDTRSSANDTKRAKPATRAPGAGAPARTPPRWARTPLAVRCTAWAAAALATAVCVGSQLGLGAAYTGELEVAMARLKPAAPASQAIAATGRAARRSQAVALDDTGARRLWPWTRRPQDGPSP